MRKGAKDLIPRWQRRLHLVATVKTPKFPRYLTEEDVDVIVTLTETTMKNPRFNLLKEDKGNTKISISKNSAWIDLNPKLMTQVELLQRKGTQLSLATGEVKRERGPR
jgi:hypothetical protein